MQNKNPQNQPKKKISNRDFFLFTLSSSIYFGITGLVIFFFLLGTFISLYIAIGCLVLMIIIPLLIIIIPSLHLSNFSQDQKKFFRIYALFMFLSFPTIFFINQNILPGKDWIYRLPFSFVFLASLFAASTPIISIVANLLDNSIYHESDTLITKLAFDFLVPVPLAFIFNILSIDLWANFVNLILIFLLVPFFIYFLCGLMLVDIVKAKDKQALTDSLIESMSQAN